MLATLLGSETRARVLRLLLSRGSPPFHVRELVREAAIGTSGVQRELARLTAIGLVAVEPAGGRRSTVRVIDSHPLAGPLRDLLAADSWADGAPPGIGAGRDVGPTRIEDHLNPHLRARLPGLVAACRRAGVKRAVLFGSAVETDAAVRPNDVDLLVRLGGPDAGRAARYYALVHELETVTGLPVDLVEDEGIANPFLRDEIERTGVVIHEAA